MIEQGAEGNGSLHATFCPVVLSVDGMIRIIVGIKCAQELLLKKNWILP